MLPKTGVLDGHCRARIRAAIARLLVASHHRDGVNDAETASRHSGADDHDRHAAANVDTMAQVIPNPVAPPPPGGGPVEAPVRVPVPPAASPEYGVGAYLMGYPETTGRDIGLITGAKFQWVKMTVPWRSVEASCKGCIDWDDLDRVGAGAQSGRPEDHGPRRSPAGLGPRHPGRERPAGRPVRLRGLRRRRWRGATRTARRRAPSRRSRSGTSRTSAASGAAPASSRSSTAAQAVAVHVDAAAVVPADQGEGPDQDRRQRRPLADGHQRRHGPAGRRSTSSWLYENDLDDYSDAIGVHAPGYGSAPEAELNSNPAFPHPLVLLPPRRAASRHHGRERRRRQAGLGAGVRLDHRHRPP